MSDGVKIALIVGGSAVAAFVILKVAQPAKPPITSKPTAKTDFLSLQGIAGIGSFIAGAFGRGDDTKYSPDVSSLPGPAADSFNRPDYASDYTSSDFLKDVGFGG